MTNNNHFITRENCPVCSTTNFNVLYDCEYSNFTLKEYLHQFYSKQGKIDFNYLQNSSFTICECENCKLIFQKHIPDDDLMFQLYEKWINPEIKLEEIVNGNRFSNEYYLNYAVEISNILSHFKVTPNKLNILDYGMGWGQWARMAIAFGCNVYGVELSTSRIAYAEKNGIKVLNPNELVNYKFDFINTEQVLEHITNPADLLIFLKPLLNENGILKISVPDGNNYKKLFETINWNKIDDEFCYKINNIAPLEHINCFNYYNLKLLSENSGFKIIPSTVFYKVERTKYMYNKNSYKTLCKYFFKSITDMISLILKSFTGKKNTNTTYLFLQVNK